MQRLKSPAETCSSGVPEAESLNRNNPGGESRRVSQMFKSEVQPGEKLLRS